MLFFQAALLLGYLDAHLTTRWLGARRQALLHIVVMASAVGAASLERLGMRRRQKPADRCGGC